MPITAETDFGIFGVGVDLVPIVPSDDEDLPEIARSIRCRPDGVAGTLRFTTHTGEVRNTYIEAGGTLWCVATRVHEAGTTATKLEAIV